MYLLTGLKFAFQRLTPSEMLKNSLNFHKVLPNSKMSRVYPEGVSSLVSAMLAKHPDKRPTWEEILDYEPIKEVKRTLFKDFPQLRKILDQIDQKEKKELKPIIQFSTDLDKLEKKLISLYGNKKAHTFIPWPGFYEDKIEGLEDNLKTKKKKLKK